jgi:hypothetical protein
VGQLELIGSGEPICNCGQCEGLHVHIHESLQANLSLSEARNPFSTLANAKACMQIFMSDCGPTRAYRKQGAHSQCWPMRRPACKYSCVTVGQLRHIRSRKPIQDVGQCEGLHMNADCQPRANLNASEAGCPFSMFVMIHPHFSFPLNHHQQSLQHQQSLSPMSHQSHHQ